MQENKYKKAQHRQRTTEQRIDRKQESRRAGEQGNRRAGEQVTLTMTMTIIEASRFVKHGCPCAHPRFPQSKA